MNIKEFSITNLIMILCMMRSNNPMNPKEIAKTMNIPYWKYKKLYKKAINNKDLYSSANRFINNRGDFDENFVCA